MPASTSRLALPYPVLADTADVPRDIQALADKLDALTAIAPPLVTALPGSPVDGQQCFFQSAAMATDGLVWHLRYRTAALKWEVLGASPLFADLTGNPGALTTGTGNDIPGAGVTLALPNVGDYMLEYGAKLTHSGNGQGLSVMPAATGLAGGVAANAASLSQTATTNGLFVSVAKKKRFNGISGTAKLGYTMGAAGGLMQDPWLSATPIRLG